MLSTVITQLPPRSLLRWPLGWPRRCFFELEMALPNGTAADFELMARIVTGPEPTAALAACHQCAFWDCVSLP